MKNRLVDLGLIVGLVLIAGAIVWTLFSLGSGPRGPGPDAGAGGDAGGVAGGVSGDVAGDGAVGGVVPVAPGGGAAPA
ncbi:MAG: hypothetical protein WD336_11560, partial [Trueperaceae bacterium]